jgi:hypothetical protein
MSLFLRLLRISLQKKEERAAYEVVEGVKK